MKFACDRCQTRYSISDEKVQGKVLKIRCKTCGNIIVLREQGAETAPAVESAASAQGAAAGGVRGPAPRTEVDFNRPATPPAGPTRSRADIDWFVAVKGKQHGPLKRDQVIEFLRQGHIHDRSYCWNEELTGWTRLRELPEFAEAAAQIANNPPAMPPPPPSDDEQSGAQVLSLEAHRERRGAPAAQQASHPGAVTHDPFAAVSGGVPGVSNQTDSSAPRESTRVFIMNAGLHNRGRKHKTYAIAAVATVVGIVTLGYLDYAGHVQIPLLSSVVSYTLERSGVEAPRKRQLLAKFSSDEPMDPELECKLLGNCVRAEAQRAARRRSNPTGAGTGGVGDLNLDGAFGNVGGQPNQAFGPDGKPIDPGLSNPDVANDIRAQLGTGMGKPMTTVNPNKLSVNDSIAIANTSGPDMEQVMKVVKQNIGSVKPCVESAAKNEQKVPGKQKLLVLIRQNGTVGAAKLMDASVNATMLGECVVKAAKKWKFPPQGQEFEVEVPLILSTG
jgi:predicted Zn finger-like uncharacterized protein